MAEQANVCVKNLALEDIQVILEQPDGSRDNPVTITTQNDNTTLLPEPGVLLIVSTPNGKDTQTCPFEVISNPELVSWSIMDDHHWTIQLATNPSLPEVPTTVNVEVGGDEP